MKSSSSAQIVVLQLQWRLAHITTLIVRGIFLLSSFVDSLFIITTEADAESALADAVGRKAALTIGKLTSTWSKKVLSVC